MGSKTIGLRLPDDLAQELEKVSVEKGQTTSEFVRQLIDDALYPVKNESEAELEDGEITIHDVVENVNLHEEQITEINKNIEAVRQDLTKLFDSYDEQRVELAGKLKELGPSLRRWGQQVEVLTATDNEKLGKLSDVEGSVTKLQDSLSGRVTKLEDDLVAKMAEIEDKLQQKIVMIGTNLKELSTKLVNLEDAVKKGKERLPASDKYKKIKLTNKTEHHYILYRMPWGLTRPEKIDDDEYIDLAEPLD
jgi:predicted DNA-binding protein